MSKTTVTPPADFPTEGDFDRIPPDPDHPFYDRDPSWSVDDEVYLSVLPTDKSATTVRMKNSPTHPIG